MKKPQSANEQDIDTLRQRHASLNERRIQAATHLEAVTRQLEQLKKEAREQYGTDDLDTLRRKLEDMKSDNERRRAEYQAHLDAIETRLADVERRFAEQSGAEDA